MQANWSLILNVILLGVVVIAIRRLMKTQRQSNTIVNVNKPSLTPAKTTIPAAYDDIIAVRRVPNASRELSDEKSLDNRSIQSSVAPSLDIDDLIQQDRDELIFDKTPILSTNQTSSVSKSAPPSTIMFFLLAKENRQLAGYELLQTLLAAGLRYGEGQLFHRHQHASGQGPVLCSLAAATETGVFDLQNIGAFSARGLCLFMQASGNPSIDSERFTIMHETAKQLAEELDTLLLDDKQKTLTQDSIVRYQRLLNIVEQYEVAERVE